MSGPPEYDQVGAVGGFDHEAGTLAARAGRDTARRESRPPPADADPTAAAPAAAVCSHAGGVEDVHIVEERRRTLCVPASTYDHLNRRVLMQRLSGMTDIAHWERRGRVAPAWARGLARAFQ